MYKICACCLSVLARPYRSVFSPSSALLSHSGPRMTGGLSWLPPTITSVWESLATEGQTLSIKTEGPTSGWALQWFLGVGLDTCWKGFGILTLVSDSWDLRMALQIDKESTGTATMSLVYYQFFNSMVIFEVIGNGCVALDSFIKRGLSNILSLGCV